MKQKISVTDDIKRKVIQDWCNSTTQNHEKCMENNPKRDMRITMLDHQYSFVQTEKMNERFVDIALEIMWLRKDKDLNQYKVEAKRPLIKTFEKDFRGIDGMMHKKAQLDRKLEEIEEEIITKRSQTKSLFPSMSFFRKQKPNGEQK